MHIYTRRTSCRQCMPINFKSVKMEKNSSPSFINDSWVADFMCAWLWRVTHQSAAKCTNKRGRCETSITYCGSKSRVARASSIHATHNWHTHIHSMSRHMQKRVSLVALPVSRLLGNFACSLKYWCAFAGSKVPNKTCQTPLASSCFSFYSGRKKCSGSQWGAPLLLELSDGKTITFVRGNPNDVKIRPKGAHFNEIMKLIDIILFAFVWLAIQAMWTRRLNYSNWISSPRLSAS